MKTEELIEWLKGQNVSEVSENTGIPKDRMYKWTKGVASPKTEDFQKLLNYFNKINGIISTPNKPNKVHDFARGNKNLYRGGAIFRLVNIEEWAKIERTQTEIDNMAKLLKKLEEEDKKDDKKDD